tara:strand:+ start:957 stop:1106 length:150 start_codon:yes stop_codon:yes gene_type:complete
LKIFKLGLDEYNIDKFIANNVNKKSPKNAPEGIIGKKTIIKYSKEPICI